MPSISLSESMRFLFPGVVLYLYLYIIFPIQSANFAQSVGVIEFPLILIVLGSLIYFVYRTIIYDPIIERILCKWNPLGSSYRKLLKDRYGISTDQATRLFILIRDNLLLEKYKNISMEAAGIHMLYIAGILGILTGGILGLISGIHSKYIILTITGFIVTVGGYFYNSKYEALEHDMVVNLGWEKIDTIANTLNYQKKG
jgi:hypothetical protein